MRNLLSIVCLAALATPALAVDNLATWTFETSLPLANNSQNSGPYAAESGIFGGPASGHHATATTDYSNPVGNGTPDSYSSNEWTVGDYYQFSTSSLGYSNISISWEQASSNTGPVTFDLEWSTDGTNFATLVDNYTVAISGSAGPGIWSSGTYLNGYSHAHNGPSGLDNQGTIYFRMTNESAVALTGTDRVDSVVISGTLIPEPASLSLLALGALALTRRTRKA